MGTSPSAPAVAKPAPRRGGGHKSAGTAGGDALTSPMQGTIVKIAVADGDEVAEGDLVVVLEAMKMEQPLNAHKAGVVTGLSASVGDVMGAGSVICEIK
jgi:acetyl-CoA/propionyl-CoA carboxylase biotin carboxyl carrier protein